MKKGDVLKGFLKANNITAGTKEIFNAYNNAYPDYQVSYVYFKNVVNGTISSNYAASQTAASLDLTVPNLPVMEVVHNNTFTQETEKAPDNFETKKVTEINFNKSILDPIKTDTVIDELFSYSKGIMPATVGMIPGESGVGKTTLVLKLLGMVKDANPDMKIVFVSSEMNQIHIFKYKQRINFEKLDVCMLSESDFPEEELTNVLKQGWDLVLIDSLADTINKLRNQKGYTANVAESKLLSLMDEVRRGENEENKFTSFLCTHHMTKSGSYTGSTNLKHMTDYMMNLLNCEQDSDKSYIEFSKNRDGKTGIRLYYKISHTGVDFDVERFEADMNARQNIDRSTELLAEQEEKFKKLFFENKQSSEAEYDESTDSLPNAETIEEATIVN
jgi:predicted ATP-dependent serine protease